MPPPLVITWSLVLGNWSFRCVARQRALQSRFCHSRSAMNHEPLASSKNNEPRTTNYQQRTMNTTTLTAEHRRTDHGPGTTSETRVPSWRRLSSLLFRRSPTCRHPQMHSPRGPHAARVSALAHPMGGWSRPAGPGEGPAARRSLRASHKS